MRTRISHASRPCPSAWCASARRRRHLTGNAAALDALNERILDRVNRSGEVPFLWKTKLNGGYVI